MLAAVAKGLSNAEIAEELFMCHATAKTHVSRLLTKLNARDRAQLVMLAYEAGVVRARRWLTSRSEEREQTRLMDRINHVKIVSPDPKAVEAFLTEVLDIPAGWSLGECSAGTQRGRRPCSKRGRHAEHGGPRGVARAGGNGGMIVGSPESRQFQVFHAETPRLWAVAIGTRHVERAHDRCVERGLPCTDVHSTPWGQQDGGVTFFFVEVGGILFEVMRVEAEAPA